MSALIVRLCKYKIICCDFNENVINLLFLKNRRFFVIHIESNCKSCLYGFLIFSTLLIEEFVKFYGMPGIYVKKGTVSNGNGYEKSVRSYCLCILKCKILCK